MIDPQRQAINLHAIDFKSATFKDVDLDEQQQPIGLFGIPWNAISQRSLSRLLGKSFNIQGYSNFKKQQLIDAISEAYINRDLYGDGSNTSTRKQRQCPYRLLNILFSDEFAGDFSGVGDTPTRAELDSGDARNNRGFWIRVQAALKEPHPIYD